MQLVEDLDDAVPVGVGMPDGVRRSLGERELEILDDLLGQRSRAREAREGEPAEGDVLRAGRDDETDGPGLGIASV
jgi:hypothetical protein